MMKAVEAATRDAPTKKEASLIVQACGWDEVGGGVGGRLCG